MEFEFLIPIFGILLVMIPVAGVTIILTSHFALKPLVETLAKAMRESGVAPSRDAQLQMTDLTEQVHLLTEQVARLEQAQEFDRKLAAPRS